MFTASTDGPVVDVVVSLPSADWSTPLAEVHTGEWEVAVPLEGLAETCGDATLLDWVVVATTDDGRVLDQTPSGVYDPDATPGA